MASEPQQFITYIFNVIEKEFNIENNASIYSRWIRSIENSDKLEASSLQNELTDKIVEYLQELDKQYTLLSQLIQDKDQEPLYNITNYGPTSLLSKLIGTLIAVSIYPNYSECASIPLSNREKFCLYHSDPNHLKMAVDSLDLESDPNNLIKASRALVDFLTKPQGQGIQFREYAEITPVGLSIQNFYILDLISSVNQITNGPSKGDYRQYFASDDNRVNFAKQLDCILNGLTPYVLIEAIFILITPTPSHQPLSWLHKSCGHLLSVLLMKPQGVKYMFDYFCHGVEEADVNFTDFESVSKIFTTTPKICKQPEEYTDRIVPQLALHASTDLDPENPVTKLKLVANLASFILVRTMEVYDYLSGPRYANVLMQPMVAWIKHYRTPIDTTMDRDLVLVKQSDFKSWIHLAQRLFIDFHPNCDRRYLLVGRFVTPIFHLITSCRYQKSTELTLKFQTLLKLYLEKLPPKLLIERLIQLLNTWQSFGTGSPLRFMISVEDDILLKRIHSNVCDPSEVARLHRNNVQCYIELIESIPTLKSYDIVYRAIRSYENEFEHRTPSEFRISIEELNIMLKTMKEQWNLSD